MIKYCKILDNKTGLVQLGVGCSEEYYKEIGMLQREVKQSDIDNQYYLADKCPMKTAEQKEAEEKERIATLSMTKLDFVNKLEELGINYQKIKDLLAQSEEAQKQWDLCSRVFRFNPLLDNYAKQLGITPAQLDEMFLEVQNGI